MSSTSAGAADIIVSGPSGAGKTTLINYILTLYAATCALVVSHTTRAPRDRERDGIDYHFVDVAEFRRLIEEEKFLEHIVYDKRMYGTSKSSVTDIKNTGKICIFDVGAKAAKKLKEELRERFGGQCVLIFIKPPSIEVLRQRLKNRGNVENIERRMESAEKEMEFAKYFDHTIVNDILENAKKQIDAVVSAEVRKISEGNFA